MKTYWAIKRREDGHIFSYTTMPTRRAAWWVLWAISEHRFDTKRTLNRYNVAVKVRIEEDRDARIAETRLAKAERLLWKCANQSHGMMMAYGGVEKEYADIAIQEYTDFLKESGK